MLIFSLCNFISCTDSEKIIYGVDDAGKPEIYADFRLLGEDEGEDWVEESNTVTAILDDGFKNDFSLIYISQKGPDNLNPEFENPESENMYVYMYYDNPAATWDGGYNFAPVGNKELDWTYIRDKVGKIDNTYLFYSMYFPEDNQVRFEVEKDQTTLENLKKSNILGARHTTDEIDSRLRFSFYHLMSFLNITLYVPVFDPSDNSGFLSDALDGATVLSVNRFFKINYSVNTGADSSPSVDLYEDAPLENLDMYVHSEYNQDSILVEDFYPNGEEGETDVVYKYTLSILLPAGQSILNRDLLRFTLHTPGGTKKNYLFNTNQNTNITFARGAVTQLALYLPRHQNNTILINSEIVDWNHCSSEMNLVEE